MEDVVRGMGEAMGMGPQDPTKMLHDDHEQLMDLIGRFERSTDEGERRDTFAKIGKSLDVHAAIEESIFYPAAQKVIRDQKLIDQSLKEHAKIKQDISLISMSLGQKVVDEMGIGTGPTTSETRTMGEERTYMGGRETTGYTESSTHQGTTGGTGMTTGQPVSSLVSTLKNDISQHVQMEEGQMFPEVRQALADDQLQSIAGKMSDLKGKLM